jgi:hypothetical protein
MWSDTITALSIVTLHLLGLRCCWSIKYVCHFYSHGDVENYDEVDNDKDDVYEIYNLIYVGLNIFPFFFC